MDALKTGVTVKVTWSNEKGNGSWYGYVYHTNPVTNRGLDRPFIVKCIGASLSLKDKGAKIWRNKFSSDIVTEICNQFNLKPKVTPSKVVFAQQSLYSQTYWEKIQELAVRNGYVAQLFGTELHFHPLDQMIDQAMGSIPVLEFKEVIGDPNSVIDGATLDYFELKSGDFSDNEGTSKRIKTISGVDPLTGKPFGSTQSPSTAGRPLRSDKRAALFAENMHSVIATDKAMAEALAIGAAQLGRYTHFGKGLAQGNLNIGPYKTVEIKGINPQSDGYWVVTKVTHLVDHLGQASSEFECMSDGTSPTNSDAFRTADNTQVPIRNLNYEIVNQVVSKPTETTLQATTLVVSQSDGGFVTTPRRWVGM